MRRRNIMLHALTLFLAFSGAAAAASPTPTPTPCDGVDRHLTDSQKAQWAAPMAKQFGVAKVDVLQSFAYGHWRIVYAATHETDEVFLFYAGDPATSRYVTLWGGAAMEDEEAEIRAWALKDAPGIPERLAACFAWHVSKHRDM
ncbi:hypothetical protein [Dyella sp.]|uniref:hypothetical protein n=1 Tax=Dyella sp. TaxID=1869338 RepID=UPI00285178B1|nr:hypothetical protein [Dyella sp.]MDR3447638.1 hypothetical protein [Dyella sp.]